MKITMTREALLERLADRLKAAKAEDARLLAEHKKEEAKSLITFRKNLRDAMKWNYETAKKKYSGVSLDRLSCPMIQANFITRVIASVKLETRKSSFVISENSDIRRAILWVPESEKPKETACD